jgi:serine/threonine-protein kinase RsbW
MDNQQNFYRLTLSNRMNALEAIQDSIDKLVQNWSMPVQTGFTLNLVLEEAFTNIVKYAYQDQEPHSIDIEFVKNDNLLEITLIDDGLEYDPTLKEDPDINLPAEERQIGGLGIFLIKKLMDSVEYKREEGKSYLKLTKDISK